MSESRCAVCGWPALRLRWQVAGEAGEAGLIPTTDRFGTALADVSRCAVCGHSQLDPMPSDAELNAAYEAAESGDYVEEEAGQLATADRTLALIERHTAPGRLLDLGCWVGFMLAAAERRGWEAVGVEPSAWAAATARERLGVEVVEGELFSAPVGDGYDCVTLGDVIEHIPDAGGALDRVRELLRPGGVVAMMLPDAGSDLARAMGKRWWAVIPTHVHYFTRETMTLLLERHGFEVLELTTHPKAFTVGYYLDRLGGYAAALARSTVGAARAIGVANRMWAPDFGDRMLVIARA